MWSVAESCLILCDLLGCSLSGSSVHGIFQARILEWVINFSGESQLCDADIYKFPCPAFTSVIQACWVSPWCEAARANTMTGGPDLTFCFPWNGKIPYPHQAAWSQPINRHPKGNKGNISRESWKVREHLSLNKSLRKFGPIKLLCKHVTNPLKPATNCLCSPYKLV